MPRSDPRPLTGASSWTATTRRPSAPTSRISHRVAPSCAKESSMAVTSDFRLAETVEHASLQDAGLLDAVQPHTAPIRTVLDAFDAEAQTIRSDQGRNAFGKQEAYDTLRAR